MDSAANLGEIDDILDLDGDGLAGAMANVSIASDTGATLERFRILRIFRTWRRRVRG
jgi:hypothetical protein